MQTAVKKLPLARERDRRAKGRLAVVLEALALANEAPEVRAFAPHERERELHVATNLDAVKIRAANRAQAIRRQHAQIGREPVAATLEELCREKRVTDLRPHLADD